MKAYSDFIDGRWQLVPQMAGRCSGFVPHGPPKSATIFTQCKRNGEYGPNGDLCKQHEKERQRLERVAKAILAHSVSAPNGNGDGNR